VGSDYKEKPWVWSYLDMAEYDAMNKDLEVWLRLSQLAVARVQANGHAPFQRGELAQILGVHPDNVGREIRKAVGYKYLVPGSATCCLVPNPDRFNTGGLQRRGSASAVCRFHENREAREVDRAIEAASAAIPLDLHDAMVSPS
jgi:hypothetical protein